MAKLPTTSGPSGRVKAKPADDTDTKAPAERGKLQEAGVSTIDWLDERTSLSAGGRWMLFRKIPKGTNWFYTLGSATMFAFLSQAVTGVFLAMYYDPSATRAYESIRYLTNEVFLGEFVRGMHKWGSTVMVILIFLHMARTFFFGAYKYPRELNWVVGVVLLILTLMMSFTGYLLPFDQRSYWATTVGVAINGTGPLVGPYLSDFLRAGPGVRRDDAGALLRDPHARCCPAMVAGPDRRAPVPRRAPRDDRAAVDPRRHEPRAAQGIGVNQVEKEAYLREYSILKSQGKPFFPYAVAKDGLMACVVMASIIAMAIIFGAELGPKVDPTTTTYVPRPEWYFYFLFEVLRIIKPSSLTPLAAIGVPTLCMILLFLLPFYDRSPERRPERRPIAMAAALFTIAAMAFLTYEGAVAGSPNQIDIETPRERHGRRPRGAAGVRGGQAGRRAVGLPRLPQDRSQRQHGAGSGPDGDRRAAAAPGDRAHARQPDGADAGLPRSRRRAARQPRRVPRPAEVPAH